MQEKTRKNMDKNGRKRSQTRQKGNETRQKGNETSKKKKVSAGYLERAALHYLGRFSSSEKNLKDVLFRKIRRRNEDNAAPSEEQKQWVDDVIAKCCQYGYVDDTRYAKQRAESMLARGKPARMISMELARKGIAEDIRKSALKELSGDDQTDIDHKAAAAYVRRRRFGPFRRPDAPEGKAEKELAAMARAGFAYDLSRKMLELKIEEIEYILIG